MENILFESLASDDSEFVNFYPKGYRPGAYKYIFVTGGVMSGVGKGIFASALGYLLKCYGYSVSLVKTEGYLNIDSGTLNPFRHGEVFVLDDGTESDLDLGNYERFLDTDLDGKNFITSGKIYSIILSKERSGEYLGRDVLVIPHLTGEIKYLWRQKALQNHHDIVIVEIGGTVGDYENLHYIEAARQMRIEEGYDQVLFCHVSPIVYSDSSHELKSKPTQHGVRSLMQFGIQPDFIICRSDHALSERIKEKVSLYCNVPLSHTIEVPTQDSIYQIPHFLDRKEKLTAHLLKRLKLSPVQGHTPQFPLEKYEKNLKALQGGLPVRIMIAGKYVNNRDSYLSITQALEHSGTHSKIPVKAIFFDVEQLSDAQLPEEVEKILMEAGPFDGVIVPGGFGQRGIEEKIKVARYARENQIPFLGICLGFQLALIEMARNLCECPGANSTEFDKKNPHPVISLLHEQREVNQIGGTMRLGKQRVKIFPSTLAHKLYQSEYSLERFRHRYEFNPKYRTQLEEKGVVFSGMSATEDIYQIFELKNHPYFVGTQFHPEYLSRPLSPRPFFQGLVEASQKSRMVGEKMT